jgi:S-adenosylmethionine synthetase
VQVSPSRIKGNWKEELIEQVVRPTLPENLVDKNTRFIIQSCERKTQLGLTGRKLTVDTYGGYARHGGGAFSGKDISKLDRSASYMARYIAKNIVSAKLSDYCEIQLAFAIGHPEPVSINISTNQTNRIPEEKICEMIRENFPLKYESIIQKMQLNPAYYQKVSVYGHFGRDDLNLPWEKTDKAEILKAASEI